MTSARRNICIVTGTRAEFGLMATTLREIKAHPNLRLQIVATGMHLDKLHGDGIASIRRQGWRIDEIVPWPAESGKKLARYASSTGSAMAGMAMAFERLKSEVVLVVGDRVEAFAAAGAAHLSGLILAHVHGGDRAAGQADDCLRHSISKLSHVHFPATKQSAERLIKLGEDRWRIRRCGSPGVDGITSAADSKSELSLHFPGLIRRRFALVVQHPVDASEAIEAERMRQLIEPILKSDLPHIVIVHPNNDPGSGGIRRVLNETAADDRLIIRRDVPRSLFLGLMRHAAVLVGNSSSGIIEAASFGTPVLDIGPRQSGRECGSNVMHVEYGSKKLAHELRKLLDGPTPIRFPKRNIYGGGGAGKRIAQELAKLKIDTRLQRKLIAF